MCRIILRLAVFSCMLAMWIAPIARAAIVIDTFETPTDVLIIEGPAGPSTVVHSGAGILGTRTFSGSSLGPLDGGFRIGEGTFSAFMFGGLGVNLTYSGAGFPQDFSGGAGIQFDFLILSGSPLSDTVLFVTLNTSTGTLVDSVHVSDILFTPSSVLLP